MDQSDDRERTANIISLDERRRADAGFVIVPKRACTCSFIISEKERSIICKVCGRSWEPFDAFLYLARHFAQYATRRDALKRELVQLEERRQTLQREVRNLKAQRRRAERD